MKIETSDIKSEPKNSWSQVFFWFQIRPYGILLTIILGLYLYKIMNNRTSIKLIPPTELTTKFNMISEQIIKLRKNHPTIFCGLSTFILGALAIIGHLISGASLVLIGLIIAGFVSTRYNFKVVKIPLKVDFTWADKFDNDIVDEFLPEVTESNLFVLQRASDDALVSSTGADEEEKSEEIPSDLMIPDSIPEIDENSDSSEEDLFIKTPQVDLKISDSENQKIEFKKGYFKKDSSLSTTSSSSDEECLSKGLNFDYVDNGLKSLQSQPLQKSQSTPQTSSVAGNIASQLPGLMTNLVSWSMGGSAGGGSGDKKIINDSSIRTASKTLDSTDEESDFEIVETEEI